MAKVVPAHLNFLAIYNPELGRSEENERDQIVFYFSGKTDKRLKGDHEPASKKDVSEEQDEQMRQIGLAQGVINFANSFSDGENVDSIDTEKHRIVVTELETGWWILASIALTVLPRQAVGATAANPQGLGSVEYSAREISPAELLLQQLHRAHKIFLLHHSPTLSDHYMRLPRHRFTALLANFWNNFAQGWDVLLHGNPAVEIYDGIKVAAGGELGVGVGEEEWGSGEREVLEDMIRRTEGLNDVVVSRFGDAPYTIGQKMNATSSTNKVHELVSGHGWLGCLQHAGPADGMMFSGSGALSSTSLHGIAAWMEWIYTYGETAYGVRDNPTSTRRKRTRKNTSRRRNSPRQVSPIPEPDDEANQQQSSSSPREHFPGIPPPIVTAVGEVINDAAQSALQNSSNPESKQASSQADGWANYLTLGIGSKWFGGKSTTSAKKDDKSKAMPSPDTKDASKSSGKASVKSALSQDSTLYASSTASAPSASGRFLIGFQGSLDKPGNDTDPDDEAEGSDGDGRIIVRTAFVEITQNDNDEGYKYESEDSHGSVAPDMMPAPLSKWKRLRMVVYVNQPFMFVFLFEPNTAALNMPSFFRRLHTNLLPLHKPLLQSTSPTNVACRLESIVSPSLLSTADTSTSSASGTPSSLATNPIYDMIYSPMRRTIHSSIPNIPLPNTLAAHGYPTAPTSATPYVTSTWTRIEALNVHSQILSSWIATRKRNSGNGQARKGERERSAKTGKGWWVCWLKIEVDEEPVHDVGGDDDDGSGDDTITSAEPRRKKNVPSRPEVDGTIMSYETQRQSNYREAVLIRRATGAAESTGSRASRGSVASGAGSVMSRWTGGYLGSSTADGDQASAASIQGSKSDTGSGSATYGLGVDARRYVESLLSLNR